MLTHLDLCSGIGGFSLASGWSGYTTIGFCEIDPFCQRVLRKHWPEVPIHDDLRTLDGCTVRGWIADAQRAVLNTGSPRRGRDANDEIQAGRDATDDATHLSLATAGYPCQPFSQAGKRLGEEDDRHLWPAIAALVAELKPDQCLFENVAGHITLGLDRVLADLEEIGYACGTVVVPACAVNAPHRRDRVWIMANAQHSGRREQLRTDSPQKPLSEVVGRESASWLGPGSEALADSDSPGLREQRRAITSEPQHATAQLSGGWPTESGFCRVAHGVPRRVDRLRSLGNSIVPQVAYEIISAMRVAA